MNAVSRLAIAAAAVTGTILSAAVAHASEPVRIGLLNCKQVAGKGMNIIIHSESVYDCELIAPQGREHYVGYAGVGFGIDLEWHRDKTITYSVATYTGDQLLGEYALTGTYFGVKGSGSFIIGGGAQVLMGGSNDTIALSPLALESSSGIGFAGGIAYLSLKPGRVGPEVGSATPGTYPADPYAR
jgi:hypothetical protein